MTTQVKESLFAGNPRMLLHVPNNKPSWRRFGDGVANIDVTFYAKSGTVSIHAEETAFAGLGDKRDVSRGAMIDIDKPAAAKLARALATHLGEPDPYPAARALEQCRLLLEAAKPCHNDTDVYMPAGDVREVLLDVLAVLGAKA